MITAKAGDASANAAASSSGQGKPRHLMLLKGLLEMKPPVVERPPIEIEPEPSQDSTALDRPRARLKLRHIVIAATFFCAVLVPTIIAGAYMMFVAADQYHSTTSFSVRSLASSQPSDLMGIFTQASGGSTVSDSYMLLDYVLGPEMVQAADQTFDLEKVFAPRGLDYFYGLGGDRTIEEKIEYWKRMVSINFDQSSGVLNLNVKAFDPASSQKLSRFIVDQSEKLVNSVSDAAKSEVLRDAENAVAKMETRLGNAQIEVRKFRSVMQEADPTEGAKLAAQIVATLEQQLSVAKTELSVARSQMSEESPRVKVLNSQIASLEQQLSRERDRFGDGQSGKKGRFNTDDATDVAGRLDHYEKLETERGFSEKAYTSALAGLEKAKIEASSRDRYMAVVIKPTLPQLALYPSRLLNTLLVFAIGIMLWGVGVMVFYNIRDRN
ncbi:RkpR, polysaccharide export protein [Rhizobium sp. Leaf384]|uniref:hypothetical protein n=1 Tax=unclassified Rhizobium TaxID=2613769 RepID=UPI00071350C2|nr:MULTISPECIES: hypothetical protein [unclassified Rhizobium]KQS81419.1 RkpR, polysaccharide export protein [Rhizobium sp. Leaf384]KQS87329.1 RkpR, polysaccharide export protein [Rhizobium sp. Leaf383]